MVGNKVQLSASASLSDNSSLNVTGTGTSWMSPSDSAVVTVSPTGVITAIGPGQADIFATYRGVTGAGRAVVVPSVPVPCTFTVSPTEHTYGIGVSFDVKVTTSASCTWTVENSLSWLLVSVCDAYQACSSRTSATGTGTLNVILVDNTPQARHGTITVAGQTITVSALGLSASAPR